MENIVIRKIISHEVESAMALALEVFMQFDAPDYDPSGVETFKRDIVENPEYLENARQGICPIYGAFDGDKIVALMGMRTAKPTSIWCSQRRSITEKASFGRFSATC